MQSGNDISNLSYKELQALALRYRVPGNIKKQLLIEVLQAARCGNEQEVDKLLANMRQTRKKRIRKGKPMKLSLSSTPIHSPVYDMAEDYYAAQHRLPYQWVGAEEEIPNRQDESNRVPQYEEFRQFLLRRIQRDYQTYNTNNDDNNNITNNNNLNTNDRLNSGNHGGLIDARNEVDPLTSSIAPLNSLETVQPYSEQVHAQNGPFDYQIVEDPTGNGNTSILLRRMLQAPVGADLGEIASPEAQGSSCRIWGGAEYNQGQANLLDNSDTLSANSDMNGNEDINNWPIGSEYYKFVNSVRDQLILNPGNNVAAGRAFDDPSVAAGPFSGSVLNPGEGPGVQYQLLYANQLTDIHDQPNCPQPWEMVRTAATFDAEVLNDDKVRNYTAKTLPAVGSSYYDTANVVGYASSRPIEYDPLEQDFHAEEGTATVYPGGQNGAIDHCGKNASGPSRSERKFYHDMSNGSEIYSPHHSAKQTNETACNYPFVKPLGYSGNYHPPSDIQQQAAEGFAPLMQNLPFTSTTSTYKHIDNCSQWQTTQNEAFNRPGNFGCYTYNGIRKVDDHPTIDGQQLQCIGAGGIPITGPKPDAEGEGRARSQNKTVQLMGGSASTTLESDVTCTSLEPFWPQRPAIVKTTENCLENILNLNNYGYIDYSRIDQTSCIYCYAAPIVTQRLFSGSSPCSQKRRLIAEYRQHTFSPYWLLYDDTRTGMQMSKNTKVVDKDEDSTIPADSEADVNGNEYNISESSEVHLEKNIELNGNNLQGFQPDKEQITTEFVGKESQSAEKRVSEETSSPESKWPEQHVKSTSTSSDSNDRDNTPNMGNTSPKGRVDQDVISDSAAMERGIPYSEARD